jgi:hypothetical protein
LNCPDKLKIDTVTRETQLNFLQAFWDAEVLRFGETGAEGWKNWHATMENKLKEVRIRLIMFKGKNYDHVI